MADTEDIAAAADRVITGGIDPTEALRGAEAQTDAEFADNVFKQHEEAINVTRKESYLSATNLLRVKEAKEGKKDTEWDKLDPAQLSDVLSTSVEKGLTNHEAQIRFERDGPNELEKPKRPTFCVLFIIQILNLIIMLLIAAAIASIVVNATSPNSDDPISYVEGIAIFIIVFLNAGIGAFTENQAAGALEALSKLSQPKARVVREGEEVEIPSTHIVKGDVLLLGVGDIVPADCRLVIADDLKVNEMLLTGEPDDVSKFARMKKKKKGGDGGGHGGGEKLTPENMAFSSCMVTNGKSTAYVVEIGMNTRVGRIAKLLQQSDGKEGAAAAAGSEKADIEAPVKAKKAKKKKEPCLPDTKSNQTPLQRSLQDLGVKIGIFAIVVCLIVFIIGVALEVKDLDNPESEPWLYMILIAVTLAVAAIPEGIPLCVTISLSTGCSDMVKKNVLVRRIAAVETLGCASVICTDKTGTLTEGKMTMVKMWASGQDFEITGKGFNPTEGSITYAENGDSAASSPGVVSTLASAVLCCNTRVEEETDPDDGTTKWVPYGNSSEAPIIVAAGKVGLWSKDLEPELPRVFEVPFSSSRKMMLTVSETKNAQGSKAVAEKNLAPFFTEGKSPNFVANVKGAPNFILKDCDSWTTPDGKIVPLTAEDKENVLKKVDELSCQALRVLAVAARVMDEMPFDPKDKNIEMTTDQKFVSIVKQPNLVLLGLVASIDPERDGVPQAVLDAKSGHIRVVMITGDYLPTAKAIAHNVNILLPDDDEDACALDCGKLRPDGDYLSNEEIDTLTKTVKVFARAQPEDKLEIVKSLQRQEKVSAMTGDGVNDAPALKRANIGVAMGIQGTEVAKGASDMILTDDNFCSIVTAVEKGRIIYAGIQKFVAFILSVHLAEVLQIFLCIVAQIPIMRTPLQILFLILVTDLPPSVALGMERVVRNILNDRPRPKDQPIVLWWQWQGIVANGLILSATTIAVYIWGLSFYVGSYTVDDILGKINNVSLQDELEAAGKPSTIETLSFARTSAFISLVWSENVRAYTSRSFTDPVWVDLCANTAMQKAIFFAQVALYCAVFIPGLSDTILRLFGKEIGWEGWVAAFFGAVGTLVLCELYKCACKGQVRRAEEKVAEQLRLAEEEREKLAQERQASMIAARKAKQVEPQKA
mmetsp:Transcript_2245/g.3149  ORF Transcript_2245/g.3149 Transcript_2245/m.3149 type:complete len:1159 (+) Transcript_2245:386-3862(+)